MKLSNYYMPTLRDDPADGDTVSNKLLQRGAFIRKTASGIYSFLPLGQRVINKIENIVRKSMEKYDSIEISTSVLQPKEIWEMSGRWETFGPEMFKLKDRHGRDFCLGPTAEEYFTYLIKDELTSYKQLPLNLYQIVSKFRDEKRPRFGINRSRDFIMKDAYSFDEDQKGLEKSYKKMWDAYVEAFDEMGLIYKIVEGDSGTMGGRVSHEFIALSESGEGIILFTEDSKYAATEEKASFLGNYEKEGKDKEIELVETPNKSTIEDVSKYLNVDSKHCAKVVDLKVNGEIIIVVIPGDRTLNISKLINYLNISEYELEMADEEDIKSIGSFPGFTGPKGLKDNARIIIDKSITQMNNLVIGSNQKDKHFINANYKRDFDGEIVEDVLTAKEGDLSSDGKGILKSKRGIEVGNIFQLGTKYSDTIGAYFLDKDGKQKPFVMGSYGIGISRSVSAIVEQNFDEKGIIWPISVAPFECLITIVNVKKEEQYNLGFEIYDKLKSLGVDVAIDDRNERAGVKFNDRDLIGIPYRITVGKDAGEDIVEFSTREDLVNIKMNSKDAINKVKNIIKK
ncbi:MAG: proline--tRNA ligase [Peptoniphilaceae bacterium]|nr:proline--tRNA ligase [Peptoniphilaceae bacterium]MDY3738246.1 proline--tRNA ligase [Peptoniphilaceae bacterium]